jgi:enoyl-CoA hydratase/carnithine racemase
MGPEIVRVLHNLQKPSIAAVNGAAYGLGCGIALACDIRIASRAARFSEAFIRNGLIPADGSTWQLPKLIGMANTLWMQYTGDPIDGEQALRMGLVNELTDDALLLERAVACATRLAKGPVYAMGLIKQLVHQGFQQDLAEHMALASRAQELARRKASLPFSRSARRNSWDTEPRHLCDEGIRPGRAAQAGPSRQRQRQRLLDCFRGLNP